MSRPWPNSRLHDYQKRAIRRMIDEKVLALFVDMGLGKTAMTLFTLQRLLETGRVKRVLIVAPIRVMYSVWRQEAAKWAYTSGLTFQLLHESEKVTKFHFGSTQIDIVNYEGCKWIAKEIRRHWGKIKRPPYDAIVFDESTMIKNPSSVRYKVFRGILPLFKYRYILTAKPAPNSLTDVFTQQYVMDLGKAFGRNFTEWSSQYFYKAQDSYKYKPHNWAKEAIYRQMAPYVERLKAKDYIDVPELLINPLPIDMSDEMRGKYKFLEKEFFVEMDGHSVETFSSAAKTMKMRQFLQGAMYVGPTDVPSQDRPLAKTEQFKMPLLNEIMETRAGKSVLVGIQFKYEVDAILREYPYAKVIVGGVSGDEADKICVEWNKGNVPLLVCNPQSLAHGVNLQSIQAVIMWMGIPWSLDLFDQLCGRIARQGYEGDHVTVHLPVVTGTVDEIVVSALKQKEHTQESLLDAMIAYREGRL